MNHKRKRPAAEIYVQKVLTQKMKVGETECKDKVNQRVKKEQGH